MWDRFTKSGKRCVCGSTRFSRCSIITEEGERLRAIQCQQCNLPHQDILKRTQNIIQEDHRIIEEQELR